MNARLERKLRLLAVIMVAGAVAGLAINFVQGRISPSSMVVGVTYGLLTCIAIGGVELFILDGPMRAWLTGLSFMANLTIRSAIYATIIIVIQFFQSGEVIAGVSPRNLQSEFLVRLCLFRGDIGRDESGPRDRQHHRAARVP
jgi:adenylate cyclase